MYTFFIAIVNYSIAKYLIELQIFLSFFEGEHLLVKDVRREMTS